MRNVWPLKTLSIIVVSAALSLALSAAGCSPRRGIPVGIKVPASPVPPVAPTPIPGDAEYSPNFSIPIADAGGASEQVIVSPGFKVSKITVGSGERAQRASSAGFVVRGANYEGL